MRPISIVLLLAAALLACVDGLSTGTAYKMTEATFPAIVHPFTDNQGAIPTTRSLRTFEENNEDDEERGGLDAIAGIIKAGASKVIDTTKLHSWLYQNANGVQVLKKLQLGDDIYAALKSSRLDVMSKYITMFNEKHPDSKISLIATLTAHYGDDAVAKALVTAQKNAKTKELAKQLRSDQLAACMNDGQSVVGVFRLLQLSDDGYLALTSRKLEVLEDYIALFNREKSAEKTLLSTLTAGFGGERRLAKLLVAAKANPFTVDKAKELESALFKKWLASGLQPGTVLKNLKLDNNVRGALGNLNLQTLESYISVFNKNNPASEVSLLGTLTAHYGEDIVAKGLVSAKRYRATERIATELQTQQLTGWLDSGKSVDEVYALLKLKQDGIAAIVSRKLDTLDAYIKLYNRENSAHESLTRVLATGFGGEDKLAAALATAKRIPLMKAKATKLQGALFAQ